MQFNCILQPDAFDALLHSFENATVRFVVEVVWLVLTLGNCADQFPTRTTFQLSEWIGSKLINHAVEQVCVILLGVEFANAIEQTDQDILNVLELVQFLLHVHIV